jgi:hypothetical protein
MSKGKSISMREAKPAKVAPKPDIRFQNSGRDILAEARQKCNDNLPKNNYNR